MYLVKFCWDFFFFFKFWGYPNISEYTNGCINLLKAHIDSPNPPTALFVMCMYSVTTEFPVSPVHTADFMWQLHYLPEYS